MAFTSIRETGWMDVPEIVELSRRVARGIDPRLHVEGVTSADGGTGRVEILVTIAGCHRDPCALVINVRRADQQSTKVDIEGQLTEAIAGHLSPQP